MFHLKFNHRMMSVFGVTAYIITLQKIHVAHRNCIRVDKALPQSTKFARKRVDIIHEHNSTARKKLRA